MAAGALYTATLAQLSADLAPRFTIGAPDECWPWSGLSVRNGYGRVSYKGRLQLAHRLTYEAVHGAIPDGLEIDHLCCNPPCVNPAHLEAVTPAENMRRRAAAITHCPRGHAYDDLNTIRFRGSRRCRECANQRHRDRRASEAVLRGDTPPSPTGARVCQDCGTPLDTSVARNVRYCARDRQRRRALTFGRQMALVLHGMPQGPAVTAARAHLADALEELGG